VAPARCRDTIEGPRSLNFTISMNSKILTLKQVAEYLRVHQSTVYRLVKRKQLPAFKVWHDWRFELDLIDQWRVGQERAAKVYASISTPLSGSPHPSLKEPAQPT
jgi:excisionase family DNA binding protein